MELATFSDIEFVGIAADRHVVLNPTRRERTDSCGGSSSISLASGRSEVERHDQSLTASVLDIQEVYSVAPSSPSTFVVDLLPQAPVRLANDVRDTPVDELNLPTTSSCSSNPSITLPLERYRRDSQRHERVAVSVALSRACDLTIPDDASAFRRSSAPSPSSHRGPELSVRHHEDNARHGIVDDAITDQSVADPDKHDSRSLLRTYSLERWFDSRMEKTQELAVELQQKAVRPPRPAPASHQGPTFASGTRRTGLEADRYSPTHSTIILDPIELDPTPENKDTDESVLMNYKLSKDPRAGAIYRDIYRRKRKSEEDHAQSRPSRPSPAQSLDQEPTTTFCRNK